MPIMRADLFERKMLGYLAAYATRQHEARFGWKTFRVLTVTTDFVRMKLMMDVLRAMQLSAGQPGVSLFFFTTREQLRQSNPLLLAWHDGRGREAKLM